MRGNCPISSISSKSILRASSGWRVSFSLDQLRSALSRVQRKHPALRALIRKEADGLYYEADSAPEIPLRIVARILKMTTGASARLS